MSVTTIMISRETKGKLDKLKQHPRSTYEEVLTQLINSAEITAK